MRTVIGLLSDVREAKRTADELMRIGAHDISIVSKAGSSSGPLSTHLSPTRLNARDDGAIAALERMGLSRVDAQRYLDGLRNGYTLETAMIDDDKAPQALTIMRQHALGFEGARRTESAGPRTGSESVIPVVAEELRVGTREIETAGVRVRSQVQTKPVEEEVRLREEKIDVERRPANRPVAPGDQAFREQAFEVRGTTEEPIVSKEARVVEEVVVTKGENVRTETIRDTVRRQEVNVEQLGTRYRNHFQQNYGAGGKAQFDEYAPAYRYGNDLRRNQQYANRGWNDIEPNARADWERKSPGTWERFKDAIRHAWEDVKS